MDSASGFYPLGWEFEPLRGDHCFTIYLMPRNNADFQPKLSWNDIADKHPDMGKDEGIHWASAMLANNMDEEKAFALEDDPVYVHTNVPINSINIYQKFDHNNPRMARAKEGLTSGVGMPPVVLVKNGSTHEIADGHHRIAAAQHLGLKSIPAYVANAEDLRGE